MSAYSRTFLSSLKPSLPNRLNLIVNNQTKKLFNDSYPLVVSVHYQQQRSSFSPTALPSTVASATLHATPTRASNFSIPIPTHSVVATSTRTLIATAATSVATEAAAVAAAAATRGVHTR